MGPNAFDKPMTFWASPQSESQTANRTTFRVVEAVGTDWFEENRRDERGWMLAPDQGLSDNSWNILIRPDQLETEQTWFRLSLGPALPIDNVDEREVHDEFPNHALFYPQSLDSPLLREIEEVRPASRSESAELGRAASFADYPDASEKEIAQILASAAPTTSVAVFDVGLGNWNAVLRDGVPSLFFDIGGGYAANKRTFPPDFDTCCFFRRQPIVLSHWHSDHWSSADRFPESLRSTWIVPRQGSLKPKQADLFSRIASNGTLRIFPSGSRISSNGLELRQGSGPARDLNETGLALIAEGSNGTRFLFTGDCAYRHLDLGSLPFTSLVVPHHGSLSGVKRGSLPPASDGKLVGRAVVSFGEPNSYNNLPHPESLKVHRGWGNGFLQTATRLGRSAGHIELKCDPSGSPSQGCCGAPFPLPQS